MKKRIKNILSFLAISLLLTVFLHEMTAQQSLNDIITTEKGKLGEVKINPYYSTLSDPDYPFMNATSSTNDLFFVYPEIVLVSHDGNESALFYYFIWNPHAIDTSLNIDFSGTPDWVDTASLAIDYESQSFTINVNENPDPVSRMASFTASFLVTGAILYSTAFILQAPAPLPFIFVTPNYLAVPSESGTTPAFVVTHYGLDEGWEAIIDDDWITVDSSSLSANSISFNIESNSGNIARLGNIELRASDNPEIKDEITIVQNASDLQYLIASPGSNYIDPWGGNVEVIVFTNLTTWNTVVLENPGGMIAEIIQNSGSDTLVLDVLQNISVNQRQASVLISGGDPVVTDTINIIQSAPYIILDPDGPIVSCDENNFYVHVIKYGIEEVVISESPDWVTVSNAGNDSLNVAVQANNTGQVRTGIVILSALMNPSVYDQLHIIQYSCAQPYIILSPDEQIANWNDTILATPFTLTANHTGELSPATTATWLEAYIDGNSVFVTFEVNESNDVRSAEVIVTDVSNPSVSDIAMVIQGGSQAFIIVTPGFQSIPATGGLSSAFTVLTAGVDEWELFFENTPDWITDTQIFGNQIVFNIAPNNTAEVRQAAFGIRDISNPEIFDEAIILQQPVMESLLLITPRAKQLPHTANASVNFQVTPFNVELWEADANSVPEWISINTSGQNTLSLNVTENTLPETRSAMIRIYDTSNPDVNDSVFIFQYSALNSYLLAAPREQWAPHQGTDSLNFFITAVNVENWEADIEGIDWITQNVNSSDTLSLSVSENPLNETRSALIFIYDISNPVVKDSVYIFQYSALDGYLLAAPREQVIASQGNGDVNFQVNAVNIEDWEYDPETIPSWITITGSGDETLSMSVSPNEELQIRLATIRLFATNQTSIEDFVSIYQLAGTGSYLIATPRSKLVPHYGDDEVDFSVTMINTDGWEFTDTNPYEDWIVFQNLGDSTMRLSVAENAESTPRQALIHINAINNPAAKDSVFVFQYASTDSYIIVEPREQQTAGYLADTLVFDVTLVNISSVSFEVYQSTDPDMIDLDNTGLSNNQLNIFVTQNNTQMNRSARIRLFDADNPAISDTVIVHQGYAYIIVSPSAMSDIAWSETVLKINTFSNIENFSVSKGNAASWYQLSKNASSWTNDPVDLSGNDSVYLRVLENENAFLSRSGQLNFQFGGNTINTFWFTQNAKEGTIYSVNGRILVEGSETEPLAGVRVVLYDSVVTTNAAGQFVHPAIPENWTGTITPLIDASLPVPYYFFPHLIEISGDGITGNTTVPDISAFRIQPSVIINPETTTICFGQILKPDQPGYPAFSIGNTYGPITYSWSSDPVDSILLENPDIRNPEFGPKETTTYWLEVENYSIVSSDSFTIVVNQLADAVNFEGSLTVCSNQAGVVYQVIDPPSGIYYKWELDPDNPGGYFANSYDQYAVDGNIAIVNWGSDPGDYELKLFAYNQSDCASDPVIKSVEITSSQAAPITQVLRKTDDNMLYATDTLASSYQWGWLEKNDMGNFMQEFIIPEKNDWYCRLPDGHIYDPIRYYYFVITYNADGECGSRSFHNFPVGIDKTEIELLSVYPNPNDGLFILKMNDFSSLHDGHIEVYDIMGQKVFFMDLKSVKNEAVIDIRKSGRVVKGVYTLLLSTPVSRTSLKIIVQ